jgi:hypothetical protein
MPLLLPDEQSQKRKSPRSSDRSRDGLHAVPTSESSGLSDAADPYVILDFNRKSSGHAKGIS